MARAGASLITNIYNEVEVSVPVTNSSGSLQPLVFELTYGPEGYCIKDIRG
ncbi:hypothetical protein OG203_07510 [Nocardia sp. NBC_01499]|uniref:hypothetical protein n=1 Tax=Nocardia sp. NBC_01499 TaxID=2903597 RepID=UPI00386F1B6C